MIITHADRHEMISALAGFPLKAIVELGVFKGDFAAYCSEKLHPKRQVLIDFWDYTKYRFVLDDAVQSNEREAIFNTYFEGNPVKVLASAYETVKLRLGKVGGVEIRKADIAEASTHYPDATFDIIYLDGNHTYEFVLRDLLMWFPKLKPGGLFVCNDYFESALAAKQNIGVIPAMQTFLRRQTAYPIALSLAWWSDLYISNQPSSPLTEKLTQGLLSQGHKLIEDSVRVVGKLSLQQC